MNQIETIIPEGFEAFGHSGNFADAIGPFFIRQKPDRGYRYGFRTGAQHANPNGVAHGGALFSFADHITGHAIVDTLGRPCATLKFKVEYLSPGPLDALIEGEVELTRVTRTMAFVRVRLFAGSRIVLTADGCGKLFAGLAPGQPPQPSSAPADIVPPPPGGFRPFPDQGGFPGLWGPVYYHRRDDGSFRYGFQARAMHDNSNGIVHGGVLYTFADDIIARAASGISKRYATTVTMNVEYLSAGPLGAWIEGATEVTHMDDGFAFIRARVFCGGRTILTADGICRLLGAYKKIKPQSRETAA
ncbi:MAG: PaaI family thioesterase [Alphaproteobacteria bacterium]